MFVSVIAQFIARDDVIFPLHVFLKTHTHTHTHVGTTQKIPVLDLIIFVLKIIYWTQYLYLLLLM